MQVNSVSNNSFGKIVYKDNVKPILMEHTAYGLGLDDIKNFKEKKRLCNLKEISDRFVINVSRDGVVVLDKSDNDQKAFYVSQFDENTSPNILFHLFTAAMNYTLLKASDIFND